MKRTTTTVTGIAALIGATLMITTPTPTSAASPTRTDLCLAIDDEPMCDVVHSTPTSDPPPETRIRRRPHPVACGSITSMLAPRSGRPSRPG